MDAICCDTRWVADDDVHMSIQKQERTIAVW
jgi:hypothetical protein